MVFDPLFGPAEVAVWTVSPNLNAVVPSAYAAAPSSVTFMAVVRLEGMVIVKLLVDVPYVTSTFSWPLATTRPVTVLVSM